MRLISMGDTIAKRQAQVLGILVFKGITDVVQTSLLNYTMRLQFCYVACTHMKFCQALPPLAVASYVETSRDGRSRRGDTRSEKRGKLSLTSDVDTIDGVRKKERVPNYGAEARTT